MILSRAKATDPLCERCLKLQKVVLAVVAFELADDEQKLADSGRLPDPTLYSRGFVSLCAECAQRVEEDGGEIRGCNQSGYPLDPLHSWYRGS
jgi:hypothetical protein